jgi:hypothetical protein
MRTPVRGGWAKRLERETACVHDEGERVRPDKPGATIGKRIAENRARNEPRSSIAVRCTVISNVRSKTNGKTKQSNKTSRHQNKLREYVKTTTTDGYGPHCKIFVL